MRDETPCSFCGSTAEAPITPRGGFEELTRRKAEGLCTYHGLPALAVVAEPVATTPARLAPWETPEYFRAERTKFLEAAEYWTRLAKDPATDPVVRGDALDRVLRALRHLVEVNG